MMKESVFYAPEAHKKNGLRHNPCDTQEVTHQNDFPKTDCFLYFEGFNGSAQRHMVWRALPLTRSEPSVFSVIKPCVSDCSAAGLGSLTRALLTVTNGLLFSKRSVCRSTFTLTLH